MAQIRSFLLRILLCKTGSLITGIKERFTLLNDLCMLVSLLSYFLDFFFQFFKLVGQIGHFILEIRII